MAEWSLQDRTGLVTGASRGIGRAIAAALFREGARLAVSARDEIGLREVVTSLTGAGSSERVIPIACDLLGDGAPEALVTRAAEALGGLDFIVNNAGAAGNAPVEETTNDMWDTLMQLNARAPFLICRAALPYLKRSRTPAIVNISSVVGRQGYPHQSAYSASKHALMGFTKALARELHAEGIRVHAVSPGGVATSMIASVRPDIPADELIAPEEIADIVTFLLSRRGAGVIDEVNIRREASLPWQ